MEELTPAVGRVVLSKCGRDQGNYFIVTAVIDKDYVFIADGNLRTLAKPKRKKVRHLTLTHDVLEGIAEKLTEGKKVFDKEVGSALRAYSEKE